MAQNLAHFRYGWRENNRFRLLIDGERFFPQMLSAIDSAQHYVALEMYLVESGKVASRFIDALLAAAERGVQCYILFDDFGAGSLHKKDRQRLEHQNTHLIFYNPIRYGHWFHNLFRDHRKLLLVDRQVAYVGGAGLTDDFDNDDTALSWRDTVVEISGPCVEDWHLLFETSWPRTNGHVPFLHTEKTEEQNGNCNQMGRVTLSQMTQHQEIRRSVNRHLHSAEHWIWLSTAYFVPTWRMRRALRNAAQRGVDVRLLLPGEHTDHPAIRHAGRRYYSNLLQHGIRIYEYQPRFSHSKVLLCDRWCTIGSTNFDRWNLLWNLEANQEIDDPQFAGEVKAMFLRDFSESVEIDLESWQTRPWYLRMLEWHWGLIDALLYKLSLSWRKRQRRLRKRPHAATDNTD